MGQVTIHVYDESRKETKSFGLDAATLVSSMRFFQSYLKNVPPRQNAEISVHCDLVVFGWLLQYVKASAGPSAPVLTEANCVAVLISSHFLQMDALVDRCAAFIARNLVAIIKRPTDVLTLAPELFRLIVKMLSDEEMEKLHEGGDCGGGDCAPWRGSCEAVAKKAFKVRLEALLKAHHTSLCRCTACGDLFSAAACPHLPCRAPAAAASQHLPRSPLAPAPPPAPHDPDPAWRFQEHLQQQRQQGATWRALYWHTWSLVPTLYCHACAAHFPPRHLFHCAFHPGRPHFTPEGRPEYTCCGQPAPMGGYSQAAAGCTGCEHQTRPPSHNSPLPPRSPCLAPAATAAIVATVKRLAALTTTPYTPSFNPYPSTHPNPGMRAPGGGAAGAPDAAEGGGAAEEESNTPGGSEDGEYSEQKPAGGWRCEGGAAGALHGPSRRAGGPAGGGGKAHASLSWQEGIRASDEQQMRALMAHLDRSRRDD